MKFNGHRVSKGKVQADLHCGKAEEFLPHFGRFVTKPQLLYVDPPFNIGRDYGDVSDSLDEKEHWSMLSRVLCSAEQWSSKQLTVVVNVPDSLVAKVAYWMDRTMTPRFTRTNWCIWHYRFGQNRKGGFINSKTHVLIYQTKTALFNAEAVAEPSDRVKYGDKRTMSKKDGMPAGLRVPLDVWYGDGFHRVNGNARERWKSEERPNGHDNQIPEAYFRRIVKAYTSPGGTVIDAFMGSGGLGAVALAEGRNYVGIEKSKTSYKSARKRVQHGPLA